MGNKPFFLIKGLPKLYKGHVLWPYGLKISKICVQNIVSTNYSFLSCLLPCFMPLNVTNNKEAALFAALDLLCWGSLPLVQNQFNFMANVPTL